MYTPTQTKIVTAADRYGVPRDIALAVARAESGYNQAAVSPKGAIGVMQLMPTTAAGLGVDPRDESQNIDGGVLLLSQLYTRYGDWNYALAAYNAGPTQAARGPSGWPAETKTFVPRVLGYAGMAPPDPTVPSGATDSWDTWDMPVDEAGLLEQSGAMPAAGLALLAAAAAIALLS